MYDKLKTYCKNILPFTDEELKLIDAYFEVKDLKKKEFLLQEGKICNFIAFIEKGTIRHFHIKNGVEKTCDISFDNSWITDFQSFTHNTTCMMNLQAMENSTLFIIRKENLYKLYKECNKYETFGRLMVERVAVRATEIAMSLSSDKPEERFNNLLKNQPDFFQRIPQKYIANFLGISPESLSRIQKRIHTKLKTLT
ncbi:MAG: Crp/Fnr family transcriptional regulator [Flavobacteriaceae bacterium]|jgi:CRP-like cAMP-binding protein|nr:Crp/Fnr family transcriptional regulator [Flavobacteriaceae bacterium]